jgi:hypothetical protein
MALCRGPSDDVLEEALESLHAVADSLLSYILILAAGNSCSSNMLSHYVSIGVGRTGLHL